MSKLSPLKRLPLAISAIIASIFAVAPLVYSAQALLVFDIPKLAVVQGGIEIVVALYLIYWLFQPTSFRFSRPSWTNIALLTFILLTILSSLFAFSPHQAWCAPAQRYHFCLPRALRDPPPASPGGPECSP